MTFHLGKPILAMLLLTLVGGVGVLMRPTPPRADLEVWAFSDSLINAWRGPRDQPDDSLATLYEQRTGLDIEINQVSARAIDTRLLSLIMANQKGHDLPDVVTIEINSVGKFFRPPLDEVGLLPLNDYIQRDGLEGAILSSRLAPWTKEGVVFGIPNDVHPVSITYRKDLFDQAGVDLASARTWPEFQQLCLRFQEYWHRQYRPRVAIDLSESAADAVYMMLLQRGVNILDDRNRVHIDHPKVAETLAFYAALVAGPRRIGASAGANQGVRMQELAEGNVCALITPDWMITQIRLWSTGLEGKLAMMRLPRFDPSDYPTSTWGGTMAAIPRHCADPEAAWQFLKFLMLSQESLDARLRYSTILPPVAAGWSHPMFHRPDPLFADGQVIGELYINLARQLPPRYVTPFTTIATSELSINLYRAVDYIRTTGSTTGLQERCQSWLDKSRRDLERYIQFGQFK